MEATRLSVHVTAAAAHKKEEEKAKGKERVSSSAPKAVGKGAPKRKGDGEDECLSKKVSVTPEEKLPKKPSPPKSKHKAGTRLMTTSGLVTQDPNRCLLTHKDYAIEIIESIIRDRDMDPCAEEMTEKLGASGLFDLDRVHFFLCLSSIICYSMADGYSALLGLVHIKVL